MRALLLVALLGLLARVQAQANWAACVVAIGSPCVANPTATCTTVGGGTYCVPACSSLTTGNICYNADLDGTTDRLCTGSLNAGFRCTATSGGTDGTVATLAAWGACTSPPDTCPTGTTCTDDGINPNNYCLPDCDALALGAKCFDNADTGNNVYCAGSFTGLPARGCTVEDSDYDGYVNVNCDVGTLCANTAATNPNHVCFNAGSDVFPYAPCPDPLACVPDSTDRFGINSATSSCRAPCTEGPLTGLWSFQCRVWGKNTCYCPADTDFGSFPVDTLCNTMTMVPVEGRSATVGSWANTYCTPDEADTDGFMFGIGLPTCPLVTMKFQATGIPAFTETYEQCRKNGVPICACSAGTCEIFNEPTTGRKVGTWSNMYCTVPVI